MRARFVIASLGGHALLLLLVIRLRPPPPRELRPVVVELTTVRVAPPAALTSSEPGTRPAIRRAIRPSSGDTRPSGASGDTPTTSTPPTTSNPPTASGGNPPNLFLPSALAAVVPTPAPQWGGTVRRPGSGGNSDRNEREVVSDRVGKWLNEAGAADLARSGRVSPVWRDVERQIDSGFHPSVGEVTHENPVVGLAKQLLLGARPESGNLSRATDDSHAVQSDHAGFAESRAQQIAAARAAYEKPRNWKRVEIDAEVDADGNLIDLRVAVPSGQKELDRAALKAVKLAMERRPPRDGHVMARWAVEAAVAAKLPVVTALTDEVSGRAVGAGVGFGLTFDETGAVKADIPFKPEVHTRVSLVSVRPL